MRFQPLHLEDFDPYYAYGVKEVPPGNEAVYFKTKDGKTYKGEFITDYFEGKQHKGAELKDFDLEAVESWHPVTVDM